MSLWGIITGAGKVSDVVDTGLGLVKQAANGIDKLVYTEEEKAIDGAANLSKNMEHALSFAKIAQSESGASAVTRRIFGLIVLADFSIFTLTGLILVCFDKVKTVENIIEFAQAMRLGELTIAVIVSVFGYYSLTKKK